MHLPGKPHRDPVPTSGHRVLPRPRQLPAAIVCQKRSRRPRANVRGSDSSTRMATSHSRELWLNGMTGDPEAAHFRKTRMRLCRGRGAGPRPPDATLADIVGNVFNHFGATHGSTEGSRPTFGIGSALWTKAAKEKNRVPWVQRGLRDL